VIVVAGSFAFVLSYLHASRNMVQYAGDVPYEARVGSRVVWMHAMTSGTPFTAVAKPFAACPCARAVIFRLSSTMPAGDHTAFFDNVEVAGVPAPGTFVLALAGAATALHRRRKHPHL
jgi:MYXO-CTERM domain-containing protein